MNAHQPQELLDWYRLQLFWIYFLWTEYQFSIWMLSLYLDDRGMDIKRGWRMKYPLAVMKYTFRISGGHSIECQMISSALPFRIKICLDNVTINLQNKAYQWCCAWVVQKAGLSVIKIYCPLSYFTFFP